MTIVDISLPIGPRTPVYEGDPSFEARRVLSLRPDDPCSFNLSLLTMTTHTGTHVDAPLHMLAQGASVESISLDVLCGPARVLDLRGRDRIDEAALRTAPLEGVERVLCKTDNEGLLDKVFQRRFVYLAPDGARYLRSRGVVLVGIDYLSVDPWPSPDAECPFPAHTELLRGDRPVVILEGIDLRGVDAGDWELWCLPLRLPGLDGAPARAVLARR
jgi:arylformamidase